MMMTLISSVILAAVFTVLGLKLQRKVDCIMATLAEVQATLDSVAVGVDGLEAMIADLKAQVAAGHVITQEELDALGARAASIVADISDTSDQG